MGPSVALNREMSYCGAGLEQVGLLGVFPPTNDICIYATVSNHVLPVVTNMQASNEALTHKEGCNRARWRW
jgi:hypothetical protein